MDLEIMFLKRFCIEKKPDIFELIQAAITVGECKYPMEYKKHKNVIMKWLMNPEISAQEYESDEDDSSLHVEYMESIVPEKTPMFDDQHQKEKTKSTVTTEEQGFNSSDMNTRVRAMSKNCSGGSTKIKLPIKQHKHLNDGDQQGTKRTQSNNLQAITTPVNLKSATNGVMRNFKNIDADTQSKNLQTTTTGNLKSVTKIDCRGVMKKSGGKDFKKTDGDTGALSKNSATTLTTAKHCTEEILMKKKRSRVDFESSKRKYEVRVAEQNKAKRRTIMVDFHEIPKPAKDPCAPKRCWERRRF